MTSQDAEVERWSTLRVWLFSLRNRTPKSNLAAVEWLELRPEDRFLDLGCGLGAAIEHAKISGARLAGVDPSPSMVERASARVAEAEIRTGSAEKIPFPDESFTAVMAVATYHHWADPEAGLSEVRRVLAPGGRVLVVERTLKREQGHGLDRAGADRVAAKLSATGFTPATVVVRRVARADYLAISAEKSD